MTKPVNFAPQEIWDQSYTDIEDISTLIDYNDAVTKWLYKYIPPANGNQEVFEIGCYPGRYLYHFGKLGYVLNGIDLSEVMENKFTQWLQQNGFRTGNIENADVFSYKPARAFDIVTSFGFIEHFSNFRDLIRLHFDWCKPGGLVVIAVPDFANPIQWALHRTLDVKLLRIHNLKAMKPRAWREILKEQPAEIIFDGHFGGFNFWHGSQERNILQRFCLKSVNFLNRNFLSRIKLSSGFYSPYYGIIARKK